MGIIQKIRDKWDGLTDSTGFVLVSDSLPGKEQEGDTVLEVPGYRQIQFYTCGYVAGLMVLHKFKPKASMTSFWKKVMPHKDNGVSNTRLIQALRKSGIGVRVAKDINFDKFAKAIKEGFPVITLIRTGKTDTDHWVVVYGVGENPKRIFVAGIGYRYFGREKVIPWKTFRHRLGSEKLGLVCRG